MKIFALVLASLLVTPSFAMAKPIPKLISALDNELLPILTAIDEQEEDNGVVLENSDMTLSSWALKLWFSAGFGIGGILNLSVVPHVDLVFVPNPNYQP